MFDPRYTVVVTGVAGNLGVRLLPQLADFSVHGIDLNEPVTDGPLRFQRVDLGREASCQQLVQMLRETEAASVVHLGFVSDPLRAGLDPDAMWRVNVAGTARVIEAITEVNRSGGKVRKFIFSSSVCVYGPELPGPVTEDFPLGAHTLPYALHKQEAEETVRLRAESMGECATYLLRPCAYAGAGVQNSVLGVLRGTPNGRGQLAERYRREGRRLPLVLPRGREYLEAPFQFVHVDDMARLIAWLLRRQEHGPDLVVLNVAGRGSTIPLRRCTELAGTRIVQVPGRLLCRWALRLAWKMGISGVPPEALPYILGSYTMDTSRLRAFLGDDYAQIIHFSVEDALADSFRPTAEAAREGEANSVSRSF